MTKSYLKNSSKLSIVFLLIDSRIKPQNSDIEFSNFIGKNKIPMNIIFTKIDKVKKNLLEKNINLFKDELLKKWKILPDFFLSSSKDKTGRKKILDYISKVNKTILLK